eukprot:27610-Lingulodinium_polyedra.AAC.1
MPYPVGTGRVEAGQGDRNVVDPVPLFGSGGPCVKPARGLPAAIHERVDEAEAVLEHDAVEVCTVGVLRLG